MGIVVNRQRPHAGGQKRHYAHRHEQPPVEPCAKDTRACPPYLTHIDEVGWSSRYKWIKNFEPCHQEFPEEPVGQ